MRYDPDTRSCIPLQRADEYTGNVIAVHSSKVATVHDRVAHRFGS